MERLANEPVTARKQARRYPIGVELGSDGSAHARVWAPRRSRVSVVLLDGDRRVRAVELEREKGGYFSGSIPDVNAGARYKLELDGTVLLPDPASRAQPDGPHGASCIVDATRYAWRDASWQGRRLAGQVVYELHVGTFTEAGTYRAAIEHLPHLRDVGITVIEMMPVAEFAGSYGWGYDGVALFAPFHGYGTPDELRAFVDAAHGLGIAVILDVVYNHLGPDGNHLAEFSEHYFKGQTEWGEALNFDGEQSQPVREFFTTNAAYWVGEFHFDGLRLDATQSIADASQPHILAEIVESVRRAAKGRATIVVGENEPQEPWLVQPAREGGQGRGIDALWNDDFHHSATVAATGSNEAYYSGYLGTAQELVSAAKYGFLYQGQWYAWQRGRRGHSALDVAPWRFVHFIQNHDQIANTATGRRLHETTSPGRHRALTALLLLLPQTPMLFMGQEFAASAPFLYFAEHEETLNRQVRAGRVAFLAQFVSIGQPEMIARLDDPARRASFTRCKLDWRERDEGMHAETLAMVRDLLRLRRADPTLAAAARSGAPDENGARDENGAPDENGARGPRRPLDGAALSEHAFVLRWMADDPACDRLLAVNLGRRVHRDPIAEPLVAPPEGQRWRPIWSSEDPRYGGNGTPTVDADDGGWWLPAESAVLLAGVPRDDATPAPAPPPSERETREQWKKSHATSDRPNR